MDTDALDGLSAERGAQPPTAILLAAGRGRRLGPRGDERPKGAIRLGDESLTERTLRLLSIVGVDRCVIVTGHEASWYRGLTSRVDLTFVHNDLFATTGSLRSLVLGVRETAGDVLIIESDLVYEAEALHRLIAARGRDTTLTSRVTGSGDEVYVAAVEGRLSGLSKDPATLDGRPVGEFVGLTLLTAQTAGHLAELAACEDFDRMEYEHGLTRITDARAIHLLHVDDLAWAEIDTEDDLARVERDVWPHVVARDASVRSVPEEGVEPEA